MTCADCSAYKDGQCCLSGNRLEAVSPICFFFHKKGRVDDWWRFASQVGRHIHDYTIPQYGDKPDDNVSTWTAEDCIKMIEKYCRRYRDNARGEEERLRDMLKIAHYAQITWDKMQEAGNVDIGD